MWEIVDAFIAFDFMCGHHAAILINEREKKTSTDGDS